MVARTGTGSGSTPLGVTIPGVIRGGVVYSAANIDPSWIGTDADAALEARLKRPVRVMNDGDAAGYAEVAFGAAKGEQGVVMMTTLGTGIGTAIIYRGLLVPNIELGHVQLRGDSAERWTSNAAREREKLVPGMGRAAHGLLPRAGETVQPRPVRRRRRSQQELGEVRSPDRYRHPAGAGGAGQQCRDHRCCSAGPPRGGRVTLTTMVRGWYPAP